MYHIIDIFINLLRLKRLFSARVDIGAQVFFFKKNRRRPVPQTPP
jgi:hypothetical protein